jgi:hypothetical protein
VSLSRPGGNLTGVANFTGDLNGKRFGLFHDIVPHGEVVGVLSERTNPFAGSALRGVQAAARSIGVRQLDVSPQDRPTPRRAGLRWRLRQAVRGDERAEHAARLSRRYWIRSVQRPTQLRGWDMHPGSEGSAIGHTAENRSSNVSSGPSTPAHVSNNWTASTPASEV